jgi:hypothetical protein
MNFLLTGNIKKTDTSCNDLDISGSNSSSGEATGRTSSEEATCPLSSSYTNEILSSESLTKLSENESVTPTNTFVDKLTMEFMMNRTHYKKYLAKTDTNKYQRLTEQLSYIKTHEDDIEEITTNLLQDFIRHGNFTKYNTIVNTAFEEFLYSCVGYIKDNEYNNKNNDENI